MQNEGWHLDKKVPIGLFAGFILQTIVIVAWGTQKFDGYDSRLTALERSDDGQQSHESRIIKLEQQFDFIRADLAEIKTLLRRQVPKNPQ